MFQQALSNLGRFEWRGVPFAAWLYRIAANAIADHVARNARERNTPQPVEIAKDESDEIDRRASLFRFVNRLPDDQRRVIIMRFAEERSIREIAQQLGRSEGAIKQLQWRALQKLRTQMNHG